MPFTSGVESSPANVYKPQRKELFETDLTLVTNCGAMAQITVTYTDVPRCAEVRR